MKLGIDVGVSAVGNSGMLTKHLNLGEKTVDYDTDLIVSRAEELQTKAFTVSKRGLLLDMALKGMSVECDFEDIEASYGAKVRPRPSVKKEGEQRKARAGKLAGKGLATEPGCRPLSFPSSS
jgi:hypothetical protein